MFVYLGWAFLMDLILIETGSLYAAIIVSILLSCFLGLMMMAGLISAIN